MKCEQCTMINGAIQCLSCTNGYRLDADTAQCRECESHCKSCTKSRCTSCQEGYLFQATKGNCLACSAEMNFCHACSSQDKCFACDENIARMDSKKKCTLCNIQTGWVIDKTSSENCECPAGHYVSATHKCQKCGDIIKGCLECEPAETVDFAKDLAVSLGITQGKISYNKIAKYLKCKKAGESLHTK